jgi:hypothetical protein
MRLAHDMARDIEEWCQRPMALIDRELDDTT